MHLALAALAARDASQEVAVQVEVDLHTLLVGRLAPGDHVEEGAVGVEVLDGLGEQVGVLLLLVFKARLSDQHARVAQLTEQRATQMTDYRGGNGDAGHVAVPPCGWRPRETAHGEEAKQLGW
ncbi:MAG TPA: hypothetical protein VGY76_02705 [Solirubrobacteraceae bacterium]|nr:hypothetical protein [Solirubrobacteraceae bacterium]